MHFNEKRRLPGQGCGVKKGNAWGVNNLTLAKSRRAVNQIHVSGLLFGRDLLLAGLAICGFPWSRRLSLWVDWLDSRAEELREMSEGRV